MGNKGKDKKVTLRIAETNPKFVGRGVALLDPKVMDDLHLSTGDIIELTEEEPLN
jgi:transitional endoplasmic reticulum ATPase